MTSDGSTESVTRPRVSVVVPLFDEEESVGLLHGEIVASLDGLGITYEVVLVDDGSRDGTFTAIEDLARKHHATRGVRLRRNYGQSAAMQAGFDQAQGEIVITLDGDLQNDPADFGLLLESIDDGYDVVVGWRKDRKDRAINRKLPSWIANRIISKVTGVRIHDNGCSLKAYRREIVKRTSLYSDMHRFLLVLMTLSGVRYKEVAVNHRARQYGKSKYGIARTWKVLLDLITVVMVTRFCTKPGQWFGLVSLPLFVLTAISLGVAALEYSGGRSAVVSASVTVVLAFGMLHLLLLAVIGEFVVFTADYRETDTVLIREAVVRDRDRAGGNDRGAR